MITNQSLVRNSFWKYNIWWILWLILLTYLCNKKPGGISDLLIIPFKGFDKVVHAVFYFVLSILMLYGFQKQRPVFFLRTYPAMKVLLFSFIWGGLIELSQKFIFTYRYAEWLDQLSNTIGAAAGTFLFSIFTCTGIFRYEKENNPT